MKSPCGDGSNSASCRGDDDLTGEEKKETVLQEDSEMRGVHSLVHIPPNTVCMSIPRRCLITVEMGQATPIGQAILHSDLDLDAPKHIFLMIYILWDRKVNGVNSFFHPYYEILPQTLRNMPIFWTPDELAGLEGSYLLHQINDRNQAITEDYQAICQIAPLSKICTLDEFKWARMCVCSRNFGLQIDGHRTSALVPHADMLNHYRPRETKWTFDEERQAFTITTLQHIPAGAQVYDSYGQKCNHRFLLNYGFAVEDNRELDGFCPNEVPLELYVHPDDELFSEKLDFWTRGEPLSNSSSNHGTSVAAVLVPDATPKNGNHSNNNNNNSSNNNGNNHNKFLNNPPSPVVKRVRVCVSNNENTRLLFSLLRALACNEEELKAITTPVSNEGVTRALFGLPETTGLSSSSSRNTNNANNNASSSFAAAAAAASAPSYQRSCRDIRHPLSIRNERAAMRLLLEVVGRHLAQYPTTLSQDVADLMDETSFPRFSNKRHAKIQVRGEKEVLHHFAQWARTALDVLDVIEEELKEERGSVEVKLTQTGRMITEERPSFEYVIRRMEDDVDAGTQHTILRYCADVLGSLRREEFKNIRKQRTMLNNASNNNNQHHHHHSVNGAANSSPFLGRQSQPSSTSVSESKMRGSNNGSRNRGFAGYL